MTKPNDNVNEDSKKDKKPVSILVNEQDVLIDAKEVNGLEIKNSAIAQGVLIQANFILQEELPNGTSKIIGDNDVVKIHPNLKFTAIAPDDNS